jgi:cytoskeletal protein CcmA (bactofilin family)
MLVTGNIVCAGSMQISGRVVGDIHAAHVVINDGAHVEGNIVAVEAIIHGSFRGTIHANTVKLQSTAVVDGEILKQSLTIEQNAQFEGVARRLDKSVEAPSQDQVDGGSSKPTSMAEIVPISGAIG